MGVQILWAVVGGFLFGVFLRSFAVFGWWTIFFFVVCAAVVVVTAYVARMWRKEVVVVAIALSAIAAGSSRMHSAAFEGDPALDVWVGENVVIEGVVVDEPDARENNVRISVRVESIASTTVSRDVSVLVVAPLHTAVAYGNRVRAQGELQVPEVFDAGAGREFNYPAFLAKDGIGYELSFAQVEKIGEHHYQGLSLLFFWIKKEAIWIKQTYLEGLALALPEPEAGLAGGITAGDKRGLGKDLSETFRIVGLIHIVVLSGYNIMVVIQFIEWMLGGARVWVRSVLGVSVAIFFALITGLASSSVRAASMAIIATAGKASGRTYLASRALGVVALTMVAWNPFLLAFDPGFQLSVIATVGLLYISPFFSQRFTWVTERLALREITAATLGTQIAVLPLLLYQSGLLSMYSLPANLLALTVVPYAMLLSFIAGIAGLFSGPLAPLFAFPAYVLLWYVTSIAKLFAWMPFSAVPIPVFSNVLLGTVYVALALGCIWWNKKKNCGCITCSRRALDIARLS